jgi:uncharacterized protein YbjT (DUF2867 family)
MILVVGATGMVGSEICQRLAAKGRPVRALVRTTSDPAKVQALKDLGVETMVGDLRDRASLDAACHGASAVIETAAAMPFTFEAGVNDIETTDIRGVEQLIEAARAAGVKHLLYMSFSNGIDLDFPLRNAKRLTERRVRDSGLTWTVLRPSYFMEVWLSPAVGFDPANGKATIYGSGTDPISWISVGDVAEFAVRALDDPAARDAIIELGGPEPVSPLEVVHLFEGVLGQPIEVQHISAEALLEHQETATDDMGRSFAGLMRCYALGDPIAMDETARAFGIKLTSVGDYAKAFAGTPSALAG